MKDNSEAYCPHSMVGDSTRKMPLPHGFGDDDSRRVGQRQAGGFGADRGDGEEGIADIPDRSTKSAFLTANGQDGRATKIGLIHRSPCAGDATEELQPVALELQERGDRVDLHQRETFVGT